MANKLDKDVQLDKDEEGDKEGMPFDVVDEKKEDIEDKIMEKVI